MVQVEVRSQSELDEAIAGSAESILLDNMTPAGREEGSQADPQVAAYNPDRSQRQHEPEDGQGLRPGGCRFDLSRRADALRSSRRSQHEEITVDQSTF